MSCELAIAREFPPFGFEQDSNQIVQPFGFGSLENQFLMRTALDQADRFANWGAKYLPLVLVMSPFALPHASRRGKAAHRDLRG